MTRFCKSCTFLERYTFARSGKRNDPHDDYGFRCSWARQQKFPWAEGLMNAQAKASRGAGIGKAHAEGEFSEAMDCPTWQILA